MRQLARCWSVALVLIGTSLCLAESKRVVVTAFEQGRPMPGVSASLAVGEAKKLTSTTNAQGTVSFDVNVEQSLFAKVTAAKEGFVTLGQYWSPAGSDQTVPQQWLFAMQPATRIGGRVLDDAGHAIAGAHVVVDVKIDNQGHGASVWLPHQPNLTDANGKWSLDGVPAICKAVELAAWHYDCLPNEGYYIQTAFEPQSSLHDGSASIVLHRGIPVRGTVRSPDGNPVAGAKVFYNPDRQVSNAFAPLQTDANGNFSLGIAPGSNANLIVEAPGLAPAAQKFLVNPSLKPVEIVLGKPHVLSGRVVDAAGQGVSDITVSITDWQGRGTLDKRFQTDKQGRFSWAEAPADTVQASVYGKGLAQVQDIELKAGSANEIRVVSQAVVHLSIQDSQTGKPIEGYNIRRGNIWHAGERLIWQPERPGVMKNLANGQCICRLDDAVYQYVLRVEADGHYSADTPPFAADGNLKNFVLKLDPASGLLRHAAMASSRPIGKGKAYFVNDYFMVENGNGVEFAGVTADIADDGSFTVRPQREKGRLLIITENGAGQWIPGDWENQTQFTLQPWAKISGQIFRDDKPLATTSLSGSQMMDQSETAPIVRWAYDFSTNAQGGFTLDHVWPGKILIQQYISNHKPLRGWSLNLGVVAARPGETTTMELGKTGCPVLGHLAMNFSSRPWMLRICEAKCLTDADAMKLTPTVDDDGQLRIADAQPGTYALHVALHEWSAGDSCGWGSVLGDYKKTFTVPPGKPGQRASAVDIGTLTSLVSPSETLKIGDAAPALSAKTLDGGTLNLGDFKGKLVLLDFWATWCAPCVAEMPDIKKLREAHRGDHRLTVLGMNTDEQSSIPVLRNYLDAQHFDWPQALLGSESEVARVYAATAIPMTVLIGTDGHIIARDLRGDALNNAIEQALAKNVAP